MRKKTKKTLMITGGILLALILLGGLGYFAFGMSEQSFSGFSGATTNTVFRNSKFTISGIKETVTITEGLVTKGGTCRDYANSQKYIYLGKYSLNGNIVYFYSQSVNQPLCKTSPCTITNEKAVYSILCNEDNPQGILIANRGYIWDYMHHFEVKCLEGQC